MQRLIEALVSIFLIGIWFYLVDIKTSLKYLTRNEIVVLFIFTVFLWPVLVIEIINLTYGG